MIGPIETFLILMILIVLTAAIVNTVKFFTAWYFAFHFVKKFKRLPAHLRPPGWPPTNL